MADQDCMQRVNNRKAGIVGCGFVGSATAFALMQSGLFSEIVLLDVDEDKAEGEALDIVHGMPFVGAVKIYVGDYADLEDASVIIVTAGANQKPGETRLDLVKKNMTIFRSIIPQIAKLHFAGVLLIVSNPVDVLSYAAWKMSGLPKERVIGSGTVLDTSRLKVQIGQHFDIDSRCVHAYIIGEHGDSEIAAFSCANIAGLPLEDFCKSLGCCGDEEEEMEAIAEQVKNMAYEIIAKKDATYYGIAMAVRRICEAIVRNERSILPVSRLMEGEYGISDLYMSLPAIVGAGGAEKKIRIPLDEEEEERLRKSAAMLKEILNGVDE